MVDLLILALYLAFVVFVLGIGFALRRNALARTLPLQQGNGPWALGYGLFVLGTAASLRALDVGWTFILAFVLLSSAILAILEPGLLASLWDLVPPERQIPKVAAATSPPGTSASGETGDAGDAKDKVIGDNGEKGDDSDAPKPEPEWWLDNVLLFRTAIRRRSVETILAILLAVLAFFASRALLGTPIPPGETNIQHAMDDLRSAFKQCLDKSCNPASGTGNSGGTNAGGTNAGGTSPGGTLRLDPDLQEALTAYLKHEASQPPKPDSSFFWGGVTPLVILLLVVAAVAVVLIVRKRPAAAAPVGAAGLAAAAIQNADHLSRLDARSYWMVVSLFAGVVVVLAWWGWYQLAKKNPPIDVDKATGAHGAKDESRTVESPLNTMFSIAVLVWTVLVVCYRVEPKPPTPPINQGTHSVGYKLLNPILLNPIAGFAPYKKDIPGRDGSANDPVKELIREASKDIRPGDLLLLLGSADCTAVRPAHGMSNKDLAHARADAVAAELAHEKFLDPQRIRAESLFQHEGCTESANLRAVFPVLIQGEP